MGPDSGCAKASRQRQKATDGGRPSLLGPLIVALVIVVAGPSARHAFSQDSAPSGDAPFTQRVAGVGYLNDFGSYLRLQHYAGDGVGYTDSYTSFGLLQPLYQDGSLWFADTEFLLANDAQIGANLGLGYRYYSPGWNRIFGASLWYDLDGRHVRAFQQLGVSLETLGDTWDFRTNFYIPTGRTRQVLSGTADGTWISLFEQDHVLLLTGQRSEIAMTGLDMELGTPLPGWLGQCGVRGYGGWYHFQADDIPQVWGAMGRLEGQLTQNTSVQLTLTNDRVFDTNLVFGIAWTFPGGSGRSGGVPGNTYERLLQPVQRRANVVVATDNRRTTVVAEDPTSGDPIEVHHVDSAAPSGGTGTFESPFRTLVEAQAGSEPGQIIFVHSGTYVGGITLQPGQRLLGDGMVHWLVTRQGTVALPVLHPGERPVLLDALQYIPSQDKYAMVVAAANTEISGFVMRPLDSAPAGDLLGLPPAEFAAALDDDPAFVGGTATGQVDGIFAGGFTGDVSINNNNIQGTNDCSIYVYDITGNVNVQRNTIDNSGVGWDGVHIQTVAGNVTANENTISHIHGTGIHITGVSGRVEASRNAITHTTDRGIGVWWPTNGNPDSIAIIEDNVIRDADITGISVGGFTGVYVRNNYVSNSHDGIWVDDSPWVDIAGNELHNIIYYGVYASNILDATIDDNQIVNCREGIFVSGPFGDDYTPSFSGGTLAIRRNQIEGITTVGNGIFLYGIDALTTIDANTISIAGPATAGILDLNQTGDLTLTNNHISYTSAPAFQAVRMEQFADNQDTIFTLRGNTVEGNGSFVIENHDGGGGWLGVNLIENTAEGGFQLLRYPGGPGSQWAALDYYLQGNTGTVTNPGGWATQVFTPITR